MDQSDRASSTRHPFSVASEWDLIEGLHLLSNTRALSQPGKPGANVPYLAV